MIARLFGKNADILEGAADRAPVDKKVLGIFDGYGLLDRKSIKTVADASQAVGRMFAEPDFDMEFSGRSIASSSRRLDPEQTRQMGKIISAALPEDTKKRFLHQAAGVGAVGIISEMIDQKDAVTTAPETVNMMADRASEKHQSEVFLRLHQEGAVHENSPAYVMIMSGDFSGARDEIISGADPAARNENGNTLLHAAAFVQNSMMAKTVIEHGPVGLVNQQNDDGKPFLSMAFDPNVSTKIDEWGNDIPVDTDIERMIDLGAKHGFDFNQTDKDGNTLLHDFAGCRQSFDWLKTSDGSRNFIEGAITSQGINKEAVNNAGQTVGDVALENNWPEVSANMAGLGYLPSTDEGLTKVIDNALLHGKGKALRYMENAGVDWVEYVGGPEVAPFHVVLEAAKTKSDGPVKAAREAGLNFDVRNEKSETPFSVARDMSCNKQTMNVLREIKMDIVSEDIQKKAQIKSEAINDKKASRKAEMDLRGYAI